VSFEDSVVVRQTQTDGVGIGEDYIAILRNVAVMAAVTIDNEIAKYKERPAGGHTVQTLRWLRRELKSMHHTAGVLQMIQKGGDFSHLEIPESEWKVPA